MPTTIAVKKAKEMMAASTLSLILSPIVTSSAGGSRHSGAGYAVPKLRIYACFGRKPRKIQRK
jgi:hypothetical protein